MGKPEKDTQCRVVLWNGERCRHHTRDSTGMCKEHVEAFRRRLEVDVLHCSDCPVGDETRCRLYKHDGHDLCYYEVYQIFKQLDNREILDNDIEWALLMEERLLQRAIRQTTREGITDVSVLNRLDRFIENRIQYAEYMGWYSRSQKKKDQIPVSSQQERERILAYLVQTDDPDTGQKTSNND